MSNKSLHPRPIDLLAGIADPTTSADPHVSACESCRAIAQSGREWVDRVRQMPQPLPPDDWATIDRALLRFAPGPFKGLRLSMAVALAASVAALALSLSLWIGRSDLVPQDDQVLVLIDQAVGLQREIQRTQAFRMRSAVAAGVSDSSEMRALRRDIGLIDAQLELVSGDQHATEALWRAKVELLGTLLRIEQRRLQAWVI